MDRPRGTAEGSRLPPATQRPILMLKDSHPDWGCQRIIDMLLRGPALPVSPAAVARVLREAGYVSDADPAQSALADRPVHVPAQAAEPECLPGRVPGRPQPVRGRLWSPCQPVDALVLEVFRAAVAGFGTTEEVLTDNGTQYVTWRGKGAFTKECDKRGVKQIVASPHRPQSLGKIERFWGTLWRECVETAVFVDLGDARQRIGFFIDHYNFQRPHQGIDGFVPADRYFGAAEGVKRTLAARVLAKTYELARGRDTEGAVLPDGPGGRSAVQRLRRGGAGDLDLGGRPAGD